MRNDQIFVLLLVILLPLSGCFDGAVGDAEGTDDASSGTTIVNNYYNNTTVSSNEAALQHIYSEITNDNEVAVISVGQNQALEIVSSKTIVVWNDDYSNNNPQVYTLGIINASSYTGSEPISSVNLIDEGFEGFVWKGQGSCDYTLGTYFGENFGTSHSSICYRIHAIS